MASTQGTLEFESPQRRILTVSQLNREARVLIEGGFPLIWVEGEISNLSRPASGHVYFSLKDAAAQVRCAMFRARAGLLRFQANDGLQVLVRARVSLYETRGDFQLIVEHMEEAGHGALQRAFEELKLKLAKQGLFDAAHKKPLPAVPRTIGVITSPSGAAIRDILSVIRRRYASARVILYPVPVQGAGAAAQIAAMIRTAAVRAECDVLILARGGGSLEDLWAFNEEIVARAIYDCPLPLISGVGHEIDFTIADFVADARAPTPTGAAELVTPDSADWLRTLADTRTRIVNLLSGRIADLRERCVWCSERLQQLHPSRMLRERAQRLDELDLRLRQSLRGGLHARQTLLASLRARLQQHSPAQAITLLRNRSESLAQRLHFATRNCLAGLRSRLELAGRALHAVSPLATLERGYAIVSDAASGAVITSVSQAQTGQMLDARLVDGRLSAKVHNVTKETKP
ncbi:MAG: exodeoxyribonuclease VII large subunit [Gammaproteobacteria bacterium]|nr:exodeoxyribonuclease VII large subunit [Gammaproteobacteria bacterium]MDE1983625.1 exodeoxyribonuclease VII large subunit [Gammaproteobacteria bacterium]MDE2108280.1 exodeoxyribonuclease VII large subunit [Gammaproteobacteria bacterium]MDE2459896.1 exodeoxyribonuclease VII large subunit [Gammaproteobacteria bacterium]